MISSVVEIRTQKRCRLSTFSLAFPIHQSVPPAWHDGDPLPCPCPCPCGAPRVMQSSAASAHRQSFALLLLKSNLWMTSKLRWQLSRHFQKLPSSHDVAMLTMQRRALFLTLLSALSAIALVAASKGSALSVCTFFQYFCKS
jgi:hypothetical protein